MTLLDEVKEYQRSLESAGRLSSFAKHEARRVQAIIDRHSQPLTPEAVVEWMKSKPTYATLDRGQIHSVIYGEAGMYFYQDHVFGGTQSLTGVKFNLPLSRFHSIADLETLVRLLGVEG